MRKTLLTLAFSASALTAAACGAQGMPPSTTRAEAIAQAGARFSQIDTNHDGLLRPTEMRDYRAALRDRVIARGGDAPSPASRPLVGKPLAGGPDRESMTRADYEARAADRFDRIDTNHDGRIDAAERASRAAVRHGGRRDANAPTPARAQ